MSKTCFVISPIGATGTPVREHADDVFELLIQPALEKYGFEVVRADKIPGSGSITTDVVRLVQESALCIIDLTFHNPNVYYECGRRHESGKPFIQIVREGEEIPFDLAGIRTIKYDLSTPRAIRRAALLIQEFVEEADRTGFQETSSGASMADLLETMTRIERKVSRLSAGALAGAPLPGGRGGNYAALFRNPQQAFQEAVVRGDFATVAGLLPRLEAALGPSAALISAAGIIAINGDPSGADVLLRLLDSKDKRLGLDEYKASITALTQFYVARDEEVEGVKILKSRIEELADDESGGPVHRAYLLNQLGMLQHGAGLLDEALETLSKAIDLNPSEPAYHYNISIVYNKLDRLDEAVKAAQESLNLDKKPNPDHLANARKVFSRAGLADRAADALSGLQEVDPARATFETLTLDRDL